MTNVKHLKQRIAQLEADKQQLAEENEALRQQLEEKKLEFKLLVERVFGPKSERYIEDPDQLKIDFGDGDQIDDAVEGIKQAKERKCSLEPLDGFACLQRCLSPQSVNDSIPRLRRLLALRFWVSFRA